MILYSEKGHGLHDAIRAAGHWLVEDSGVWVASNDAAVQQIIDSYPISATIAEVCARIDAHAAYLRNKTIAGISPAEMASWPIKRAEADALQANSAAPTPFLSAEATARGITVAELATLVVNNAAMMQALECQIAGNCGKHRDAVKTLTQFADVLAYDWSTGWPSV